MEIFSVELAGVPVEIRCRYQENITFLREYLTEKEPLFTVAPGEEDLLRMQGKVTTEQVPWYGEG